MTIELSKKYVKRDRYVKVIVPKNGAKLKLPVGLDSFIYDYVCRNCCKEYVDKDSDTCKYCIEDLKFEYQSKQLDVPFGEFFDAWEIARRLSK